LVARVGWYAGIMSDFDWATYEAKSYCETGTELVDAIAHWVFERVKAQTRRVRASASELTGYDRIISGAQVEVAAAQTAFEAHVLTCSHCFAYHPNVGRFTPIQ
jgi:hypothetical protein